MYRFDHKGLRGVLDDIDDVDLVCVPDIMIEDIRQAEHGRKTVLELQQHVLDYCHDMGERFAILDDWPGAAADVEGSREHWQDLVSPDGALYGPWVLVTSLGGSGNAWVPPCGHVAGIYARTDARAGFHKAPANEVVHGVVDVQFEITQEDQGRLNDVGVNCLVSFPRRGIRVWGARTLSRHRKWRYVNVRRVFLTLVRWIQHNLDDAAFEQNSPAVWDRTRERLTSFCYDLFQRGALTGMTPEEAFFVKCDAENNRPEEREAGKVICEVGLAPLSPAEFILVHITRSAARTTIVAAGGA
jgi:phage tail sheath protein FI